MKDNPHTINSCFSTFIYFWPHHVTCEILIPPPANEPLPTAWQPWNLNFWTTREVQISPSKAYSSVVFQYIHRILRPSPLCNPRTFIISKRSLYPVALTAHSSPQPRPAATSQLLSRVCLIWTFHTNRIIQSLSFHVWLLSFA